MTMTIEKAITELEEIRDFEVTYSGYRDALNIAIDALKEKIAPAAEPEEESDEDAGADEANNEDEQQPVSEKSRQKKSNKKTPERVEAQRNDN